MSSREYISEQAQRLSRAVSPVILRQASHLKRSGHQIYDLGRGEPESATPDHIVDSAVSALHAGETHYGDVEGLFELREAIATKLERDNHWEADPKSEILVTNGGMQGLFVAMMACINPGDEVIILEPFYPHYEGLVTFPGGVPVFVPCLGPEGRLTPSREAIEDKITVRTKAILINSPHNPTGTVLSRQQLEMLVDLATVHDLLIFTDDVYEILTYSGHTHTCVAGLGPEARQRTVTISSLSKTYAMTGWRLGYVVAPAALLKAMRSIHEKSGRMATAFVQRAGVTALMGSQDCVAAMRIAYARRRDWVVDALKDVPGVECPVPDGAFYVFPDISRLGMSDLELAQFLLEERHLLVMPGSYYGSSGRGHLRLSYATDDTTLQASLEILRDTLRGLSTSGALNHRS